MWGARAECELRLFPCSWVLGPSRTILQGQLIPAYSFGAAEVQGALKPHRGVTEPGVKGCSRKLDNLTASGQFFWLHPWAAPSASSGPGGELRVAAWGRFCHRAASAGLSVCEGWGLHKGDICQEFRMSDGGMREVERQTAAFLPKMLTLGYS